MSLKDVVKVLKENDNIILTGHKSPDPDAVGSTMALNLALKSLGKKTLVLFEELPDKCVNLPFVEEIHNINETNLDDLEFDVFVSLDCGSLDRINSKVYKALYKKAKITVNIDHHISNDNFGNYNLVEVDSSSTSEIVGKIVEELDCFNKDILSHLYAGIIFDTGGFKHSTTSAYTHKIAMKVHEYNVDFNEIYNTIMGNHSIEKMKITKEAFDKIEIDHEYKIITTFITKEDLLKVNATSNDLDDIVSYLINTKNMEVAIFAYEKENGICKASLRSREVDVNKIASNFGGGGHLRASGCRGYGKAEKFLKKVVEKAKEEIDNEKL